MVAALGTNSSVASSLKLLLLGSIIEAGRRLFIWLTERFRLQYSITAEFREGDPAYDWIQLFLKEQSVWRRSHEFVVSATGSRHQWSVTPQSHAAVRGHAEYVPKYARPQLSRLYTLDMGVLSTLVEDARARYITVARESVVVRLADMVHPKPLHRSPWGTVKHKAKRRLDTIVLPDGVLSSLLTDAREFLDTEAWYLDVGIPHRRGYLLHGPPGTGKTSTVYALAGELGLEIYSISLASGFVDDAYLQRATAYVPKNAIFLLEDIDCCFATPRDAMDARAPRLRVESGESSDTRRSGPSVTLSGLLNILDGIGSDDGRLFFATTNHIEWLDPALLRPGRIDMRVPYALATRAQIHALFMRFFPANRFPDPEYVEAVACSKADEEARLYVNSLADEFAGAVAEDEFSIAQVQCFLQGYKTRPAAAVRDVRDGLRTS
ncbi:P-loop containing nucleoside triphosphate hydrolase protein [Mycena epipterygia]|nr:P-loop containing nucleoside triphosphate hydrolase protein [Mycena epipterygia]